MSFLDKIFKNNQIQEDNKKLKQTNIDFDYRLNSIYERLTKYGKYCDVYDGVSDEKIEKFSNEVYKKLNVIVPKEYKAFFKKTNGIYFGNGINILNIDEIIDKTIRFKDMMEEQEKYFLFFLLSCIMNMEDIMFSIGSNETDTINLELDNKGVNN